MMRYIDPRHKVLHHVHHVASLRNGHKLPPVNVEIDLSNRCSLGCEWCHFAYTHTRGPLAKSGKPAGAIPGGDLMNGQLALSIIDQLHDCGVKSVTWTGGGEPTLHPDFNDIVQYTARWLAQGIYTNGCHIDNDRAALMKKHMSWVYVSLDEYNADDYAKSKGVNKFGDAIAGIRRLVQAKGAATIGVGFMLHRGNYAYIQSMKSLAIDELGADYVQFRPTVRYDQDNPGAFVDDPVWVDHAMILLEDLNDDPQVYADLGRFRLYRDWQGHGYATCYFSGLQTVITPNGKAWGCVNKREHPDALLGDLAQEKFATIWNRAGLQPVNEDCRLMCRGHMANLTLQPAVITPPHKEFI